jgi:hypothetical protein
VVQNIYRPNDYDKERHSHNVGPKESWLITQLDWRCNQKKKSLFAKKNSNTLYEVLLSTRFLRCWSWGARLLLCLFSNPAQIAACTVGSREWWWGEGARCQWTKKHHHSSSKKNLCSCSRPSAATAKHTRVILDFRWCHYHHQQKTSDSPPT